MKPVCVWVVVTSTTTSTQNSISKCDTSKYNRTNFKLETKSLTCTPPPTVLAGLIISHPWVDFVLHMVIITLQQVIGEKISLLKELMNPNNRPELNSTYQIQIDAIRSAANDLEYVEPLIKQKKAQLKNSKDVHESERLFAELDGLEWLQRQILRYS